MKLEMRAPRRRKAKEVPDPIVAYELIYIWNLYRNAIFVALTASLSEAKSLCYELGPYTSKDFDFRPLTSSQVGVLRGTGGK